MRTCLAADGLRTVRALAVALALSLALAPAALAVPLTTDYTPGSALFTQGNGVQVRSFYGEHVPGVDYTVGDDAWRVTIRPDPPVYLGSISDAGFGILQGEFMEAAGWTYASAAMELSDDSLVVRTYAARHIGASVGADFFVEYVPHGTDPTDVHWIQIVTNNHRLGAAHGTPENRVDHLFAGSPYYDHGGRAGPRFLRDSPRREDNRAHEWTAELYLVTGPPVVLQPGGVRRPTPGLVTFLGGIQWGWENHCVGPVDGGGLPGDLACTREVPEPEVAFLLVVALVAIVATRRMSTLGVRP